MRFDGVLFDCDGVLVDSEPITNGILRDMLEEGGWTLSLSQCMAIFVGKAVRDERAIIEARTGMPLTEEWMIQFRRRRNEALLRQLQPIPNVLQAVQLLHTQFEGRLACASGADRIKLVLQLEKCSLMPYFKNHIFSGQEMAHSKPAPDVYLAAAASLGVDPKRCAVIEDTTTGTQAGVAAGATVFGYSPGHAGHDAPQALRDAGAAYVFSDMAQLPDLLSF